MVTLFLGLARAAGLAPEKPNGTSSGISRKPATAGPARVRTRVRQEQKPNDDQKGGAAATPKDGGAGEGKDDLKLAPDDFKMALLTKFPTFDPSWPDEIKSKWFDGFAAFKKELGS